MTASNGLNMKSGLKKDLKTYKKNNMKKQKLYFIQDLSFGSSRQVYSGHSGTGRNFNMTVGDYGKYAMHPQPKSRCKEMIAEIEKDAKGKNGKGSLTFKWNIVPMTEIELSNFYEKHQQEAYDKLREEQFKLYK